MGVQIQSMAVGCPGCRHEVKVHMKYVETEQADPDLIQLVCKKCRRKFAVAVDVLTDGD